MSDRNRQLYSVIVISVLALAILNGLALYYAFGRATPPITVTTGETQANAISVSGTGIVNTDPD